MMTPLVLTLPVVEEEILLTPTATLVLRTMKIGIELEAPNWKENLQNTSIAIEARLSTFSPLSNNS